MISSAHILNSQSHKDTFIKFDKGVNVLVGDTDAGKSALLRSLRYVIWNKPNSKSLLSYWGGVLQVELIIDGNSIVRKSDGKEIYKLNDLEFNSFGTKPPIEIEQLINMNEINNQEQIDNFFLLNETPGYVASYLNKIANLEQIDSTTKSIKSELNETNRLIAHQKEDLKKKEIELESFAFLSEFKKDLDEADLMQSELTNTTIELKVIQHLIKEVKQTNKEINRNKKVLNLKVDVDEALSLTRQREELKTRINKIDWFLNSLNGIDSQIEELHSLLDLKELISDTFKLKNKQNDLQAKLDSLNDISSKISSITERIENTQVEIDKDKDIYETELHKFGKCFFCGQKLK